MTAAPYWNHQKPKPGTNPTTGSGAGGGDGGFGGAGTGNTPEASIKNGGIRLLLLRFWEPIGPRSGAGGKPSEKPTDAAPGADHTHRAITQTTSTIGVHAASASSAIQAQP
jgi:hypothetical protein